MDEMDHNIRPKHARVLRATDVIPPFDKIPAPAETGAIDSERPEPAASAPRDGDGQVPGNLDMEVGSASSAGADAGLPGVESPGIPKYDLAENILAEQRRVAARRRRAPGLMEHEPPAPPEHNGSKASVPELPSEDLPELQRIVAEIVARDIERLCKRPNR